MEKHALLCSQNYHATTRIYYQIHWPETSLRYFPENERNCNITVQVKCEGQQRAWNMERQVYVKQSIKMTIDQGKKRVKLALSRHKTMTR